MADSDGHIGIRVRPDSKRFNADLRAMLDKAESGAKIKIGADLDSARRALRDFRDELRSSDIKVTVDASVRQAQQAVTRLAQQQAHNPITIPATIRADADTHDAHEQLHDLTKGLEATVNADADTGAARAKLALATRPRFADIIPRVPKSALAGVATQLAAVSGLRVLSDTGRSLTSFVTNLDRTALSAVNVSTAVMALGGALSGTMQVVGGLGAGLGQLSGLLVAGPGLLAGFAVGTTAMVLALKDAGKQLAVLGPQFKQLQSDTSAAFWERAKQPIIDMANSVLPSLRTGLTQTGSALGGFSQSLANAMQSALTPSVMAGLFEPLVSSINIAKGALGALVQAFVTLGSVGGSYLPRLAQWFVDISGRFNAWVQASAQSGQLFAWVDGGIAALKQFGSILGSLAGIVGSVFTALSAAGQESNLAVLAQGLRDINTAAQGPVFQGALTTIFEGLGSAASGLMGAIKGIGGVFAAAAPSIKTLGQAVGSTLDAIGKAISTPAFTGAFSQAVAGIAGGVRALKPAIAPLSQMVAAVLPIIGQLAGIVGGALAIAFKTVAPIVMAAAAALRPILPVVQGLLPVLVPVALAAVGAAKAFTIMTAAMTGIRTAVAIFTGIKAAITGVTLASNAAKASLIAQKVAMVAISAATKVAAGVQAAFNLVMSMNPIGLIVIAIAAVVAALVLFFTKTKLGQQIWSGFISWLKTAWAGIVSFAQTTFAALGAFFTGLWEGIKTTAVAVWEGIKTFIGVAWQAILWVFQNLSLPGLLMSHWEQIKAGVAAVWAWIKGAIAAAWQGVVWVFQNLYLPGIIMSHWEQIKAATSAAWEWVKSTIAAAWQGIISGVTTAVGAVRSGIAAAWNWVKATTKALWQGTLAIITGVWNSIKSVVSSAVAAVRVKVTQVWLGLKAITSQVWGGIKSYLSGVWSGIKSTISGAVNGVRSVVSGAWNAIRGATASAWGAIKGAVSRAVGGLVGAVRSIPGRVRGVMSGAGQWLLGAGRNLVQGMINGVRSAVGGLVNAAKNMAGSAINAAKSALGIHSPSRVFASIGKYVGAGFVEGLRGSEKQVRAAGNRMAGLVKDAFASRADAIRAANKKIATLERRLAQTGYKSTPKKATKAQRAQVKAYNARVKARRADINAQLKQAKAERSAAKGLTKGTANVLVQRIASGQSQLEKIAVKRAAVAAKLKDANKRLADLEKDRADYQQKIVDNLSGLGDISGKGSADSMIKSLEKARDKVREFQSQIAQLKRLGLNAVSLDQIIQAGPSSRSSKALVQGGADAVRQVNELQKQLTDASRSVANTAGDAMYGAGIRAAQGLVKGLTSQQKQLDAVAKRLSDTLVAAIKRSLRIHSPSRRLADEVGQFIPTGIVRGIDQKAGVLDSRMGDLVTIPAPSAGGIRGDATVTRGAEVNVYTSDPSLAAAQTVRMLNRGMM